MGRKKRAKPSSSSSSSVPVAASPVALGVKATSASASSLSHGSPNKEAKKSEQEAIKLDQEVLYDRAFDDFRHASKRLLSIPPVKASTHERGNQSEQSTSGHQEGLQSLIGMSNKDKEKEIEAMVQKAKLLEQLSVSPELQTGEVNQQSYLKDGVPKPSSRSSHKPQRKRISNLKKESALMISHLRMYWDSLSPGEKRKLLNVRIGDLIEYFVSNQYTEATLIFWEAVSFAKDNETWKFFGCCLCSQKFKSLVPYLKHLQVQHLGNLKDLDFSLEKDGSMDETPIGGFDIKHRIGLSRESVSLLLDKHLDREEVDVFTYHDIIADDASSVAFSVDNLEDESIPDADSLIAWLFGGPSNEEQLMSWARVLKERKHRATEILRILEEEFSKYKNLCLLKHIHLHQEDVSKTFEDLPELDIVLEMAVKDQREEVSLKLCQIDTSLIESVGVMRNLGLKLGKVSVVDYRSILWEILTSFLRDHLEDLTRQYASEKSDAVGQALLSEAALDTQKNINTTDGNTKKTQRKSKKKKKKKNKSNRNAKDSKATGGTKLLLIRDSPKSETTVAVGAHELKQQEEESRWHELEVEFQAQERKLERFLDYQGQFESGSPSYHGKVEQEITETTMDNMTASDVCRTSLKNDHAQYNCFLNVIMKSLWHVRWFRFELLRRAATPHAHVGTPCVFCSLCNAFTAFNIVPLCKISPSLAKMALSNLRPHYIFAKEGQTFAEHGAHDAACILIEIFDCLHQSFAVPGEKNCRADECLSHAIFAKRIMQRLKCYNCGLESRHDEYTSFFHIAELHEIRAAQAQIVHVDSSIDKLLKLIHADYKVACDHKIGGCGKFDCEQQFLLSSPRVYIIVVVWETGYGSVDDISTTLAVLSTEIDLSFLYEGLDKENKRHLISLVCYSGKNYQCFAYLHGIEKWIMDGEESKVIGCWDDVITLCRTRNLQPAILFFEDDI